MSVIKKLSKLDGHFKWVTFHQSMACPWVAYGGDGRQIWRVAPDVLNKQSRDSRQQVTIHLGGWACDNID